MNILLTGASGLIGKEFIKQAIVNKHEVVGVSRNVAKAQKSLRRFYGPKVAEQVTWLNGLGNLTNLNQFDAVVNLAGEPIVAKRWSLERKSLLENSRWLMTKQLADLITCSEDPPSVFISGSAIGYYGRQGSTPITEDFTQIHDEFSHQLCKKWEHYARYAESESTRVCYLRTGIVLSNKGGALGKMLLPFKLGLGGPIGDGNHFMPWIHVEDMVRIILFLMENSTCKGPYNCTAPNPVTNTVFSKTLASVLHRPAVVTMPKKVLQILMGEMSDLLTTGQNVIPEKLESEGFNFIFKELPSALEDLNL